MTDSIWGNNLTQFFDALSPDIILDAVSDAGLRPTGAINVLNSMENRVYDIGIEKNQSETAQVIGKFYRPGRWTKAQILEEHEFLKDLNEQELPVIAPIDINGQTLFKLNDLNIYYAFFKKEGGRSPDEFTDEQLSQLGRLLARLHQVGKSKKANHRLSMTPNIYLKENLTQLLNLKIIPLEFESNYKSLVESLFETINPLFENIPLQRIHGDCHLSNVLWQNDKALLMDFDDMVMGPPVQDIWLLIPGIDEEAKNQRFTLLEAYETFNHFDYTSLSLIEPLRAMRYVNFATWLSKRCEDQAFKMAFPHFYQGNYWQQEILNLQEQLDVLA